MVHLFNKICIFIVLSTALLATPAGDNIIISEVEYDAATPDNASEWFELYNPTGSSIDISGWSFTDGEGTVTIPVATPAITPGAYFIATHTATGGELTHYPGVTVAMEYGTIDVGSLLMANSGDELTLSDAGGTVIDFVSWEGHTAGWNIEADDSESIARTTSIDTDTQADWLSNQAPTPGSGSLNVNVPIANDDTANVNEDSSVNIPLITNDNFGADGASIADIIIITPPTNGMATVNDEGTPNDPTDDTVDYMPNPNYNGNDSFIYEIEDASGDTDTATVTITIAPVADIPTANDDTSNVNEDGSVNILVITNDNFGADGASIADIIIITPPTNGMATVNDEGTPNDPTDDTVDYMPNPNYNGNDSFIYEIEDASGDTDTATVTITIAPVADIPTANDDTETGIARQPVTIRVLENDTGLNPLDPASVAIIDPDGNSLTELIVPDVGVWEVDTATGTITFTPEPGFTGDPASITYTVADDEGTVSNQATVIVDYPQGSPHATDNLNIVITHYGPTEIDVLANGDTFGELGPGTQEIIFTQPEQGTVTLDDASTPDDPIDDKLIYKPEPDVNNIVVSFEYTIMDSIGNTSTARVILSVDCVSSQHSDSGNALNLASLLIMIFMTILTRFYYIREEDKIWL